METKFYKKASFPWAIIISVALLFVGIVGGWTLRGEMNAKIDAEVVSRFESVAGTQSDQVKK